MTYSLKADLGMNLCQLGINTLFLLTLLLLKGLRGARTLGFLRYFLNFILEDQAHLYIFLASSFVFSPVHPSHLTWYPLNWVLKPFEGLVTGTCTPSWLPLCGFPTSDYSYFYSPSQIFQKHIRGQGDDS